MPEFSASTLTSVAQETLTVLQKNGGGRGRERTLGCAVAGDLEAQGQRRRDWPAPPPPRKSQTLADARREARLLGKAEDFRVLTTATGSNARIRGSFLTRAVSARGDPLGSCDWSPRLMGGGTSADEPAAAVFVLTVTLFTVL